MEMTQVFHMNGGDGDYSYYSNSLLQDKVISMTKPIIEKALADLYCGLNFPTRLVMAELGCSSGPNALMVASELIKSVEKESGHDDELPEILVYLNDLPQNDFNITFKAVTEFSNNLKKQTVLSNSPSPPQCYFCGVPGSFYTRLFLKKSFHFVHSSYSLMWLSRVPGKVNKNKGNIYMSTTSPSSVIRAYQDQFQQDFSMFLKCRAEEMVSEGRMVLTFLGRQSDDPRSKECCYVWEILAMALNDMVSEGLIEEDKMDSFNIPQYTPCPKEVRYEVEKEASFAIDYLEVSTVNWNESTNNNLNSNNLEELGDNMAKCIRAAAESLLVSHFGESIIEDVFMRYKMIITNRMSEDDAKFFHITVSLTRKGDLL